MSPWKATVNLFRISSSLWKKRGSVKAHAPPSVSSKITGTIAIISPGITYKTSWFRSSFTACHIFLKPLCKYTEYQCPWNKEILKNTTCPEGHIILDHPYPKKWKTHFLLPPHYFIQGGKDDRIITIDINKYQNNRNTKHYAYPHAPFFSRSSGTTSQDRTAAEIISNMSSKIPPLPGNCQASYLSAHW